jgi:two-component system nitrate/nitrite response regulator NarL
MTSSSPQNPPSRIVLADDHPMFRDGLARALQSSGHFDVVARSTTGPDALAAIRATHPDVALLDLRMPGLDGLGVLRRLREDGIAVPIVLLSAFDDEHVIAAARAAGAAGYLTKDLTRDDVVDRLDRVVAETRGDAHAADVPAGGRRGRSRAPARGHAEQAAVATYLRELMRAG